MTGHLCVALQFEGSLFSKQQETDLFLYITLNSPMIKGWVGNFPVLLLDNDKGAGGW